MLRGEAVAFAPAAPVDMFDSPNNIEVIGDPPEPSRRTDFPETWIFDTIATSWYSFQNYSSY